MRGGHLAILRSGFGATKESEVAAGDIVPVPGAQFEQTLASASPDVLLLVQAVLHRLPPLCWGSHPYHERGRAHIDIRSGRVAVLANAASWRPILPMRATRPAMIPPRARR